MRKISADYILSPDGNLLKNHSLYISDSGKILDLLPGTSENVESYNGILTPGFVNTHCHLELSHFKNKIKPGTGLNGFINEFVRLRKMDSSVPGALIEEADHIMWQNGIQAVGDICNNESTFSVKRKSKIRYHSFVEIFNMSASEADTVLNNGISLTEKARASHTHASLVPHAPYSSSPELFELIKNYHNNYPANWSIHNQESLSENMMFINGSGKLIDMFRKKGIDMSWFVPKGLDSLKTISSYFPDQSNILLVHNTYTDKSDIHFLNELNVFQRCWFALCVKANLFIEENLPDITLLSDAKCKITIGTDSLASNDSLSILDELKIIHKNFPQIRISELLTYATRNGADYFGWEDLGAFRKNSSPGVILISNAGHSTLNENCNVTRLI